MLKSEPGYTNMVGFWPPLVAALPDELWEVGARKNDLTRRVRLISGLGWLRLFPREGSIVVRFFDVLEEGRTEETDSCPERVIRGLRGVG